MNDHAKFETALEETDASQAQFIKELKSGSEAAFGRLIEENHKKVYRIALSFVKNPTDAEDIAQEVFIKIYTSIGSFKGNSSLSTWIYKITHNLSLDFLKRNSKKIKTTKTLDDPEDSEILSLTGEQFDPEKEFEDKALREDIMKALSTLPDDQRQLIELKDIHGFSYEEIIEITGLKDGTMKSRLNRARASLKKSLQSKWNF